jgi:MFS family permease
MAVLRSASWDGLSSERHHAFYICLAVFVVGAAVNLPIPLYGPYALLSQATERSFCLVFSAYALGVLPALLFLGGLPDRVGRRIPLLAAVICSVSAVSLLSAFPGITTLAFSRLLQGLAVALVGPAATPFLAEILTGTQPTERAAGHVTTTLALGFALGGLATGLALWAGPTLLPISYPALIVTGLLSLVLVAIVPQNYQRRAAPMLRLPYFPPGGKRVCLQVAAIWCLVGTISGIVPLELGLHGLAKWGGLATFLTPFSGLICRQPCRHVSPQIATQISVIVAPISGLLLVIGMASDNLLLIMAGAICIGVAGLGFGFYGGLAIVAKLSGEERARGSAALFLSCYLGLSFAPVLLGAMSAQLPMSSALAILTVVVTSVLVVTTYVGQRRARVALVDTDDSPLTEAIAD